MKYRYLTYRLIIALSVISLGFSSCSDNDDISTSKMELVNLKLNLQLDGEPGVTMETRALGDPGYDDDFNIPDLYGYLYLCYHTSSGAEKTQIVKEFVIKSKSGEGANATSNWTKSIVAEDKVLPSNGDVLYTYNSTVPVLLPEDRGTYAHCYLFVTPKKLKSDSDLKNITENSSENSVTLSKFNLEQESNHNDYESYLKYIFTTPYNLKKNGDYYGAVDKFQSAEPEVTLRLYHVAAKVDLMWNIDPKIQKNMKINGLYIYEQKCVDCYLFRPTENLNVNLSNYGIRKYTTIADQWNGRFSYYTIPYHYDAKRGTDGTVSGDMRFPIRIKFYQNENAMPTAQSDLNGTKDVNSFLIKYYIDKLDETFTTYYRPDLKFNAVPENNKELKINVTY